jgi:phosphomevalonate kinase
MNTIEKLQARIKEIRVEKDEARAEIMAIKEQLLKNEEKDKEAQEDLIKFLNRIEDDVNSSIIEAEAEEEEVNKNVGFRFSMLFLLLVGAVFIIKVM